jgi:hypothetical protein
MEIVTGALPPSSLADVSAMSPDPSRLCSSPPHTSPL